MTCGNTVGECGRSQSASSRVQRRRLCRDMDVGCDAVHKPVVTLCLLVVHGKLNLPGGQELGYVRIEVQKGAGEKPAFPQPFLSHQKRMHLKLPCLVGPMY